MDSKKIGSKIQALRGNRTQTEIAIACHVTRQAICQYESGERIPTDDIKVKLAKYFGVSVESLFYEE